MVIKLIISKIMFTFRLDWGDCFWTQLTQLLKRGYILQWSTGYSWRINSRGTKGKNVRSKRYNENPLMPYFWRLRRSMRINKMLCQQRCLWSLRNWQKKPDFPQRKRNSSYHYTWEGKQKESSQHIQRTPSQYG